MNNSYLDCTIFKLNVAKYLLAQLTSVPTTSCKKWPSERLKQVVIIIIYFILCVNLAFPSGASYYSDSAILLVAFGTLRQF